MGAYTDTIKDRYGSPVVVRLSQVQIKVNTILDAPITILCDCYVKLLVSNIKMQEERDERATKELQRHQLWFVFLFTNCAFRILRFYTQHWLSKFHDSVIKVLLLCP